LLCIFLIELLRVDENTIKMSNAIFHSGLLKNYQLVTKPGVYMVRVGYTVTENSLINDDYPRYLVPLRVTTPEGLQNILDLLNASPVVPFDVVKSNFLYGAIFSEHITETDLPVKGDLILASFDYDENSSKLICINVEQLPREELEFIKAEELLNFQSKLVNLIQSSLK